MQVPGMKITGERKSKNITAKSVKMIILQIVLSGERPGSSRLLLSATSAPLPASPAFVRRFFNCIQPYFPTKTACTLFFTVNTIKPGKLRRYTNYVINQNLN